MKSVRLYTYPERLHGMYLSLITNPPEGYSFSSDRKHRIFTSIQPITQQALTGKIHSLITRRIVNTTVLRDHLYKLKDFSDTDILYSTGYLCLKKQPWVVAFPEKITSLTGYDTYTFKKRHAFIQRILKSEYCRAILPANNMIRKQIEYWFSDTEILKKVHVIPITLPPLNHEKTKRKKNRRPRLLFVGSANLTSEEAFRRKGGYTAIRLFNELKRDAELVIVSQIPENANRMIQKNKNIIHYQVLPQKELFFEYTKADYFLSPSFGIPLTSSLEALSFGLPIIAFNVYYTPEMITNQKEGILLSPPDGFEYYDEGYIHYGDGFSRKDKIFWNRFSNPPDTKIREIARQIDDILEDRDLQKKMSKNAKKLVTQGKLSSEERNKKLKKVLDGATT